MKRTIFIALAISLSVFAVACGESDDNNANDNNTTKNNTNNTKNNTACVTTVDFYKKSVEPMFSAKCSSCHLGPNGIGYTGSELKFESDLSGEMTRTSVKAVAAKMEGGKSLLLLKPSGQTAHTGGALTPKDGADYKALEELIDRINTPKECDTASPF